MDTKIQQDSALIDGATVLDHKQKILESRGKNVSLDLLLYSCLEHERVIRAKLPGGATSHDSLPISESLSNFDDEVVSDDQLFQLIEKLAVWYSSHHPCLTVRGVIDRGMLHEVVEPLVSFNQNLEQLYNTCKKSTLPEFSKEKDEGTFWNRLEHIFLAHFPEHGKSFLKYIHWSHAAQPVPDFEIGDVPPVGRNAPRLPRRDRDDRAPYGVSKSSDDSRMTKPRKIDYDSRHGNKFVNKSNSEKKSGRKRDKIDNSIPVNSEKSARRDSLKHDAMARQAAEEEVATALKKLRENPSLQELNLRPANSFFRRIQHQIASDEGFTTISVGEGHNRAVKVCRKS